MNEAVVDPTDDEPLFEPIGLGVKRDFSNRLPLYKSDITDGLNVQVRTVNCAVLTRYQTVTFSRLLCHESYELRRIDAFLVSRCNFVSLFCLLRSCRRIRWSFRCCY